MRRLEEVVRGEAEERDKITVDKTYLCLEAELPTSITGRDQVTHVKTPSAHAGAQLNSSDGTPFRTAKASLEVRNDQGHHEYWRLRKSVLQEKPAET